MFVIRARDRDLKKKAQVVRKSAPVSNTRQQTTRRRHERRGRAQNSTQRPGAPATCAWPMQESRCALTVHFEMVAASLGLLLFGLVLLPLLYLLLGLLLLERLKPLQWVSIPPWPVGQADLRRRNKAGVRRSNEQLTRNWGASIFGHYTPPLRCRHLRRGKET